MNILLLFPLNEPFDTIVSASATPWKSKLNKLGNIKKLDCVYPTGLLSIASYLRARMPEAKIRILDCNVIMNRLAAAHPEGLTDFGIDRFHAACAESLGDFRPDAIGISTLFCSNYGDLKSVVTFWRKRFPAAPLVGGGHLTAAIPEKVFADGIPMDAICFGEGEIPYYEFCQAIQERRVRAYLESSPCWFTPEKLWRDPQFKPERKLLQNLDDIPPLGFDLLVFPDVYFNSSRYFFVIESDESQKEMFLFSSRGCPFHCVFCASQNVHGHQVRFYSVERLKQDILHYNREFGVTRFVFYDDHFLVDKKRAAEILNFIADHGFRAEIPTPAFFALDDDIAQVMYRAGIREVNITIESGNSDTLRRIMHKPATLEMAQRAVRALHGAGILAISNILIGLPGETPESIEAGLQYLMTTEVNWFQCFVTAPLPGSELYDICVKNHYLTGNVFSMDFKKCVIHTPEFTPEFIENKVYEMNLRLNFVNNYDMRIGNYAGALRIFERIISTVINTHAFAYYYAAICAERLGDREKFENYRNKYVEMIERYPFWKTWRDRFALEPLHGA